MRSASSHFTVSGAVFILLIVNVEIVKMIKELYDLEHGNVLCYYSGETVNT